MTNDILYITGGGGSGACFRITALGDSSGVGTLSLVDPGSGYTSAPTDVVGGGSGRNATITGNAGNFQVASISLTAPGTGYTTAPTVSLSGGTGFAATAVLSSVVLTADGSLGGTGNLTIAAPITGGYGITKTGGGTATLTGSNSYSGDTTVAAGTLSLSSACLTDTADVKIASGTTLNLNTGTTDTIHKLFIDNVAQATGDWGSTTSNAEHKSPLITGSGKLHVTNGDVLPGQLTVVQWQSVNTHGGTPRGLVISDTGLGVEPRQGRINRLEITFSDPVLVGNPSTAVTVSGTNLTGPLTPASLGYTITATASGNVLAITFANGGTPVALPDTAKWRFTLNPAVITGTGGLTLTASPATTRVLTGLVGDVDGNGRVTGIDLNRISNAGTFNPTDENSLRADIDGNALIDSSDLNAAWANRAQRTDTLAAP